MTDSASLSERCRSVRNGADDDIPLGDALQGDDSSDFEARSLTAALTGRLRYLRKKNSAKIAATAASVTPNSVQRYRSRNGSARHWRSASSSRFA